MADRYKKRARAGSIPYGRAASAGYNVRHGGGSATRRRLKARFFVILGAVAVVVALVVALVLRAQATFPVEWGQADFSASYEMLIFRTEAVIEGKNYGKTDFIAEEGQRVAAGDEIAEVYSWEYNDTTMSQLLDLQETIIDYEVNTSRAGVIDAKLTDINSRIGTKVGEIEQSLLRRPQDALRLQRELEALLTSVPSI
jgi:hypothetical protein